MTRRSTRETPAQKALRRHEDFERRLAALVRIEAALPRVQPRHQPWLRTIIATAEREHPISLERYASMAEGYLSSPELEGEALQAQARQDELDMMGPPASAGGITGVRRNT